MGFPQEVTLNGVFYYNTSCQGYHNTMINVNACRNDLHLTFKFGCEEEVNNNRKVSYGKVQMQNW
jgi:hypothetical protein